MFYDPCSEQTFELDYKLWYYDSTIQVTGGKPIILDQDYYLLSTQMKSKSNDWKATFSYDIYTKKIKSTDTLYLNKLRSMWNGLLHPQKVEFYYCDERSNGEIEEKDSKGTVRATGSFKNGIPESNIKFFDQTCDLPLVFDN